MIDQNNKKDIRINSEASRGCPQGKQFPIMPHNIENASQVCHEHRGNIKAHRGIDATETRNLLYIENPGALTQGYHTLCYPYSMATCYENLRMMQQNQWHSFGNFYYPVSQEYPFHVGSSAQFMPLNMLSSGYCDLTQEFQYFVVIDFEATCDREKKVQPQEIIEFPSVLVNSATGQMEASFQTYVRPIYHPNLTNFCKELTGIQQIQVNRGVSLTEALWMHDKWLEEKGIKHTNFAVVTWSNWDCRVMLESECKFKRIRKPPYFDRWINLRVPFHEVFGDVRCNLKEAVQLAGLTWEGRAHCGLDDARNTARLLSAIMNRGFKFSITNSLPWKSADCPQPAYGQQTDNRSVPLTQAQESNQLAIQVNTQLEPAASVTNMCCLCGVMRSRCMIRKPGPKHGFFFFGCGNWTATRGAVCSYFEWAS